jgi:hypothetical protein
VTSFPVPPPAPPAGPLDAAEARSLRRQKLQRRFSTTAICCYPAVIVASAWYLIDGAEDGWAPAVVSTAYAWAVTAGMMAFGVVVAQWALRLANQTAYDWQRSYHTQRRMTSEAIRAGQAWRALYLQEAQARQSPGEDLHPFLLQSHARGVTTGQHGCDVGTVAQAATRAGR